MGNKTFFVLGGLKERNLVVDNGDGELSSARPSRGKIFGIVDGKIDSHRVCGRRMNRVTSWIQEYLPATTSGLFFV